jgi:hypothetical protein
VIGSGQKGQKKSRALSAVDSSIYVLLLSL